MHNYFSIAIHSLLSIYLLFSTSLAYSKYLPSTDDPSSNNILSPSISDPDLVSRFDPELINEQEDNNSLVTELCNLPIVTIDPTYDNNEQNEDSLLPVNDEDLISKYLPQETYNEDPEPLEEPQGTRESMVCRDDCRTHTNRVCTSVFEGPGKTTVRVCRDVNKVVCTRICDVEPPNA